MKRIRLKLIFLLCTPFFAFSQAADSTQQSESLQELLQLSAYSEASELQKILNSKVSVSSKKELTTRETPGIISLITSEEIKNSGARDLIDVLRLVPGLDFGTDVEFAIGLAVRGNWGYEGKILFLVDGIMQNEILYQTTQFGNHFPVDQIEKIEIIRGPGSTMYGGAAEYGVINIITKGASQRNGVFASGTYGQLTNTFGRRNLSVSVGQSFKDLHVDLSIFKGESNRTGGSYTTLGFSQSSQLKDSSKANPTNVNFGINYKNASLRIIYDDYFTTTNLCEVNFKSIMMDLKYKFNLSKKLNITPQITYLDQTPWRYTKSYYEEEHPFDFDIKANRIKSNLTASYDVTSKLNLIGGGDFFVDKAFDNLKIESFGEGKNKVEYNNIALFSQALFKHRIFNLTAGIRFEKHSSYGSALVPRVAITKKIENFHFKALYSNSFKSPSIENMVSVGIKPEKSRVIELEAGYQFTPEMLLTLNLFKISTKNTIIYDYDFATNESSYSNVQRSGSSGLEIEYKIRYDWGYLNYGYSFYQANKRNTVETYQIPEKKRLYLAFPAHKITLNSSVKLWKNLRVNPSLILASERYGYKSINEEIDINEDTEKLKLDKIAPYALFNLFFNYENLLTKGLTAGIGAYDVFNQRAAFIQPYNGDYSTLPGPGRELIVKLSYDLLFNQ